MTSCERAYWEEKILHQEKLENRRILTISTLVMNDIIFVAIGG